jgi:D-alanyl-D-alanine carboxypeptidase
MKYIALLSLSLLFLACDAPSSTPATSRPQETSPDPASALVWQSPWMLERMADPAQSSGDLEIPESLALSFFGTPEAMQAGLMTECGPVYLTVAPGDESISFALVGEGLPESCDGGSFTGRFIQQLTSATQYRIEDGRLNLDSDAQARAMELGSMSRVESWDGALEKLVASCNAPGAVLLVDGPSGRFLQATGVAEVENGTPMSLTDAFEIGSNTKSFTAVLALQLQEEGVWSLDDSLARWLPEAAAILPYGDRMTLRHLAQNHSGIWDYANPLLGMGLETNQIDRGYSPQDLLEFVVEYGEPSFEPGQGWEYSSSNFLLLGMALEAATQRTLDDLYRERIFEPLGMEGSFLLSGVPEPGQTVDGHFTFGDGIRRNMTRWNASQGWAAGGIVSTAEDMARYVDGLATGALFSDAASLQQMLDFGDGPVSSYSGYGLGVGDWTGTVGEFAAYGHGGQTLGFGTLWLNLPDYDTRVVLLANSASCPVDQLRQIIGASPELIRSD